MTPHPLHESLQGSRRERHAPAATAPLLITTLILVGFAASACTRASSSLGRRPPATATAGANAPPENAVSVPPSVNDSAAPPTAEPPHDLGPPSDVAPIDPPAAGVPPHPAPLILPVSSRHRRRELHDSFLESRSGGRNHHAIDIHAERGAPVLAVADGSVVKMSRRGAGGISLHLADQSGTYVFYYAHLERFTPSLREGASVRRGDVLGYVGTTGNAPESAPHLHFAVTARPSGSPWWDGSPLNPYHLLRSAQEP